jgi:hypothetical protein
MISPQQPCTSLSANSKPTATLDTDDIALMRKLYGMRFGHVCVCANACTVRSAGRAVLSGKRDRVERCKQKLMSECGLSEEEVSGTYAGQMRAARS